MAACRTQDGGADRNGEEALPIGAALSLTGNASVIGQDQRTGLELAERAFAPQATATAPAAPPAVPVRLLLEDAGGDEATATNAFRTLIRAGVVALIGPSQSQQAFAADPIAERAGVPVVAASNTATGIPEIGAFIARVSAPVTVVAPLAIEAALRRDPRIRRAAVFYAHDDAYSLSETKIFQQALRARGLEPVSVQRTAVGDSDFQNQITAALRHDPDLVVISSHPVEGGNLVRQLRELGYGGTLVAGNGMNTPNLLPICRRSCDGLLIAQAYSPEDDTPINRRFVALYRAAKGGSLPPQFAAQAFTAYQVVVEALRALQASQPRQPLALLERSELRRRLNATLLAGRYDTPLGPIRFTPEGEVIQQRFHVARVTMDPDGRQGRFRLLP